MNNVCECFAINSFLFQEKGLIFSMNWVIYCSCPNVKNRAPGAQLRWEEWIKLNRGIKEDKLMLTLGCNDSNFLPLCASIHSIPQNKWMEMRGNKRMRWNHFQSHYIYFPPISLVKCYALSMITKTWTHKHACGHIEQRHEFKDLHRHSPCVWMVKQEKMETHRNKPKKNPTKKQKSLPNPLRCVKIHIVKQSHLHTAYTQGEAYL